MTCIVIKFDGNLLISIFMILLGPPVVLLLCFDRLGLRGSKGELYLLPALPDSVELRDPVELASYSIGLF